MKKVLATLLTLAIGAGSAEPQSLRGSRGSQVRQNRQADREDLSRIKNRAQLRRFVRRGLLVPLPTGKGLRVDPRLERQYRYCRPWTARFLRKLRSDFRNPKRFPHGWIQVNSAVRTEEDQRRLDRVNPNAAAAEGPTASSHLTGATVDLAKKVLTVAEVRWMRDVLLSLERRGLVEVIEEFNQSVFHVMVFKKYASRGEAKRLPARKRAAGSKK